MFGISIAQETAKPSAPTSHSVQTQQVSKKVISITGELSDDRNTLFSESDGEVWTVTNPDRLKGHEGQQVILKGRSGPDENTIHVFSVKLVRGETAYTAKSGDSAFRR
jgi:hypothetical protein